MDNIREEIQNWLEDITRYLKGIPNEIEVTWVDIEDIANSSEFSNTLWAKYNRTFHWVHSDAVAIDHMCSEILEGDFNTAMELISRYRNITLSKDLAKEKY